MDFLSALILGLSFCTAQGMFGVHAFRQYSPGIFSVRPQGNITDLSLEDTTLLAFILDYAEWKEWNYMVMFVSNSSDLLGAFLPNVFSRFSSRGVFLSLHATSTRLLLPHVLAHNQHRLGIACLCHSEDATFLDKVSSLDLFDSYKSWLFLIRENDKSEFLKKRLVGLHLGIDGDVYLAQVLRAATAAPKTVVVSGPTPVMRTANREAACTKEYALENDTLCFNRTSIPHRMKRQAAAAAGDPSVIITVTQVYKIVKTENTTLVEKRLGFWDTANRLLNLRPSFGVETRNNLENCKIFVGKKNSSHDSAVLQSGNLFLLEKETEEESHMLELLHCLTFNLNVSLEVIHFSKLGVRTDEGVWTHLLGAVVDGSVDLALETFDVTLDISHSFFFTHPILHSMNNFYFHRPEAGGMRDIFLAPFSPHLLLCVLLTAVLLSGAMVFIKVINYAGCRKLDEQSEPRPWEPSEAALWSVSVLCMQGSTWSPGSTSGSLLLIFSLIFALIIYNSYAAFITSVLSVKEMKIKSIEDLLASELKFGYTLNSMDELYLRTANDSALRQFYFKGFIQNQGVPDLTQGLSKAAAGGYAFFVSARTARRALHTVVPQQKRCDVQELNVPTTKATAAIPLSHRSPFRRILNYRLLKMMETGLLDRIDDLLLPGLPQCTQKTTFNSARFSDVYSAFVVLAVGGIASVCLVFVELMWSRREIVHKTRLSLSHSKTKWPSVDWVN